MSLIKQHNTIVLGGTFDHFHKGHEHFIDFASNLSKKLIIGITDQSMTRHKELSLTIQPFSQRKQAVEHYCQQHAINYSILKIHDVFGSTLSDTNIDALAVTEFTQQGARHINQERKKRGMPTLPVFVCNMWKDQTHKVLTSTRVRKGEVNRQGVVYNHIFFQTLQLSRKQKQFLSKPHGSIVWNTQASITHLSSTRNTNAPVLCVVGDETLHTFIKHDFQYHLGVYDRKNGRIPTQYQSILRLQPDFQARNKPGCIQKGMIQKLMQWKTQFFSSQSNKQIHHLFIQGEEDLVATSLVLLLPLESLIYYGQPNQGIVEMKVTEKLKDKVYEVLSDGI